MHLARRTTSVSRVSDSHAFPPQANSLVLRQQLGIDRRRDLPALFDDLLQESLVLGRPLPGVILLALDLRLFFLERRLCDLDVLLERLGFPIRSRIRSSALRISVSQYAISF